MLQLIIRVGLATDEVGFVVTDRGRKTSTATAVVRSVVQEVIRRKMKEMRSFRYCPTTALGSESRLKNLHTIAPLYVSESGFAGNVSPGRRGAKGNVDEMVRTTKGNCLAPLFLFLLSHLRSPAPFFHRFRQDPSHLRFVRLSSQTIRVPAERV